MQQLKTIILSYMLAAILLLLACRDKCSEGERGNPYISMPMRITPSTDSIRLGDTLTITVEIPFDNINTRDGSRIDISRVSITNFGIDHALYVKTSDTSHTIMGLDQFKIIYQIGEGVTTSTVRTRNDFLKQVDRFVFVTKVVPLKKGLVNLVNYRAEGEMEKGCVLVDFTPICGNVNRHHNFLFDFYSYTGLPVSPPGDNQYFVWVK